MSQDNYMPGTSDSDFADYDGHEDCIGQEEFDEMKARAEKAEAKSEERRKLLEVCRTSAGYCPICRANTRENRPCLIGCRLAVAIKEEP